MKALIQLTLPPEAKPTSINHCIKQAHISQRMRRKLRSEGLIKVNQEEASWNTLLKAGDHLTISLAPSQDLIPYPLPLDIVYEDSYLLVINKPAGLLMHPTAKERHKTLANALAYYYQESGQASDFHPVHRLDKDTSGLVIIAKTALVQHAFEKQGLKFQKVYDAIVQGILPANACLHWPIARKDGSIIERTVHSSGKESHTDVQVVAHYERNYSHIRCLLHTGRTHQIRVHLSHLGYPLLGDDIYSGPLDRMQRQALHARFLTFTHPISGQRIHLEGPLPTDMESLLHET